MADPIKFSNFKFDVAKVSSLKPDDDAFKRSLADFKRNYIKRMEEAAFASKTKIDKKINPSEQ